MVTKLGRAYRVVRIVLGNAYFVETLEGRLLPKALNGKYLKKNTFLVYGKGHEKDIADLEKIELVVLQVKIVVSLGK
jgi:hypothetical protein